MNNYIEYNGMYFTEGTDQRVMELLTKYHKTGERIRIFYGDNEKYWLEEYSIIGTVGRSTGTKKIPLLINNKRSLGGSAILTDSIQMITVDRIVEYKNKSFKIGKFEIKNTTDKKLINEGYVSDVFYNNEVVARFTNELKAEKYVNFMKGLTNKK